MRKIPALLIILFFGLYLESFAQSDAVEARTKDGKGVILKSDGTWIYKPESESHAKDNQDLDAIVYFFRVQEIWHIAHRDKPVKIDDREIFKMPQARFIGVRLKPGAYKLKMEQSGTELHISVGSGMTYFLRVSETTAGNGRYQSLTEMPEKQAIFQISSLQVLEDSKLKASDIIFIKEKPSESKKKE